MNKQTKFEGREQILLILSDPQIVFSANFENYIGARTMGQ